MASYAARTAVPIERTRGEIERCLQRYGATGFAYGWEGNMATIGFKAQSRIVRFRLALPDRTSRAITHTESGAKRTETQATTAWEQAQRQRWRALLLVIKAKLEAIESGISSFEDEFMAHIALPSGQTVGEWMGPQLKNAYESSLMPPMLALPSGTD